jgi:hypothetical protein
MSWLAIIVIIVGIYLMLKVVGFVIKIGLVLLVIAALYWLFAPHLGLAAPGFASASALVALS